MQLRAKGRPLSAMPTGARKLRNEILDHCHLLPGPRETVTPMQGQPQALGDVLRFVTVVVCRSLLESPRPPAPASPTPQDARQPAAHSPLLQRPSHHGE
eukprot:CAMPEP_0172723444 /NCGR_PEP_ID=MMETSP1074-20121228/83765_1 /TAXON_ID=2916 /ORGANISM="Ceratium fusus, Strain PA161109" /LENGTH=98 /DNA_ID=CAMNT_0013549681 /DNA_START=236 /DNA_END=531 /DNA_ORIENTATION=+